MRKTAKRQRREELQRQKQRQRLVIGAIIVGIGLVLVGGFTLLSDGSATSANSFDRQMIFEPRKAAGKCALSEPR